MSAQGETLAARADVRAPVMDGDNTLSGRIPAIRPPHPKIASGGPASGAARLDASGPDELTESLRLCRAASQLSDAATPLDASLLTQAGAALELAYVWPSGDARVSFDPCPDASSHARADACLALVAAALSPRQSALARRIRGWQAEHDHLFGAWAGLRAGPDGDRAKLYLDIPRTAPHEDWERELFGFVTALPSRKIRPTMLGLDPHRPGFELYYRCDALYPSELDAFLRRLALPPRSREAVDLIADLTQRSVRFNLPSHDQGFSVAVDDAGQAIAVTWYSTSAAFFGPPDRARAALLRVGRPRGWAMQAYAAASAATRDGVTPAHGLIGLVFTPDDPLRVTATIAVAPVRLPAEELCGRPERQDEHDA